MIKRLLFLFFMFFTVLGACSRCLPLSGINQEKARLKGPGLAESDIYIVRDLPTNLERAGASFCLIISGTPLSPIEACEYFGIREKGKVRKAESIKDLRGRVRIKSQDDALKYVRLLTSPDTAFLWKRGQEDMEVLDERDRTTVPSFGAKKPLFNYFGGDGLLGVLNHDKFVSLGFSRPTVHTVKSGFQVTRWIHSKFWLEHPVREVTRLVTEFVGRDGRFARTVVKTRSTPAPVSFLIRE